MGIKIPQINVDFKNINLPLKTYSQFKICVFTQGAPSLKKKIFILKYLFLVHFVTSHEVHFVNKKFWNPYTQIVMTNDEVVTCSKQFLRLFFFFFW
jgi:hypothetical protein